MVKRFKGRKQKKYKFLKFIIILILIYVFFNASYNIIYNMYLKNLSNREIIEHIISNTKNKSGGFIEKYQNPQKIIRENFVIKENSDDSMNVSLDADKPKVYIYSTHEGESYSDKYLELYNIEPNVKMLSYVLKDYLNDLGINAIVESKSVTEVLRNHNWAYSYSYEASKEIIMEPISTGNYNLIIDLHRDSSDLSKTLLTYNDVNYARVLFIVGEEHENYAVNYAKAEKLNAILESEVPGISRGITKKGGPGVNGIYNQDLNPNIVLIELGGQYNEIEELNNTVLILAKSILKYLEGE